MSEHKADDWVYFIEAEDGYVKIGRSADPVARRSQLQRASRTVLTIRAVIQGGSREMEFQRKFWHLRHRGDWFKKTPELERFIAGLPPFVLPVSPDKTPPPPPIGEEKPPRGYVGLRSPQASAAGRVSDVAATLARVLRQLRDSGVTPSPATPPP